MNGRSSKCPPSELSEAPDPQAHHFPRGAGLRISVADLPSSWFFIKISGLLIRRK